jgi:hypothetical protein
MALTRAQQVFSTPLSQGPVQKVQQTFRETQSNRHSEQVHLDIQAPTERTEAPLCRVHRTPMVWQQGRKGYFWSCHQRMADGQTWCSYKPT